LIAEKCGANNQQEQSKAPLTVWYEFTQLHSQYSNQIREVQARNEVWVCVKVPSRHLCCKSSTTPQLFKQSTALLLADYRLQKSVGQNNQQEQS
jgi:hypothetical protein